MNFAQIWNYLKSNPYFVTASSAFFGVLGDGLYDEFTQGHLDLSKAGLEKLTMMAVGAAITALVHLYRPAPTAPSTTTTQPKETK